MEKNAKNVYLSSENSFEQGFLMYKIDYDSKCLPPSNLTTMKFIRAYSGHLLHCLKKLCVGLVHYSS